VKIKKLSYEFLTNLFEDGYNTNYIEEPEWKKFDQIERYLQEHNSFAMDNRLFRQLERYTSLFLLFGGDKTEAIDYVLYSKFLPVIRVLDMDGPQKSDNELLQLFEKLFGLENLTKSKQILKLIQDKK